METNRIGRRVFLGLLGAGAAAALWPRAGGVSAAPPEGWLFRDNDFDSPEAMAAAHAPIVDLAVRTLRHDPGPVLDLGCGNGVLVDRIAHAVPGCTPHGVELVPERAARGARVCPEHGVNLHEGDMFTLEAAWPQGRSYALVILMPGRLLETPPARAARLRERLRLQARNILVYAYPDWLPRRGTLQGLCAKAGLYTTAIDPAARVGLARVR